MCERDPRRREKAFECPTVREDGGAQMVGRTGRSRGAIAGGSGTRSNKS